MGLRTKIRAVASVVSRSVASPVKTGFTIFDDIFPHPQSGFRLAEFNAYLHRFPQSRIYSSGASLAAFRESRNIGQVVDEYSRAYPSFRERVQPVLRWRRVKPSLVYCVFMFNVVWVQRIAERAGCGFVFTLYPGGGFQLRDKLCDERLKRVLGSKSFRNVIVTQMATRDYLTDGQFCPREKVEFLYGGVFPDHSGQNRTRRRFLESKQTFDICFVAHKYMPEGRDKGYDVFVAVAKRFARMQSQARFHVVGPYSHDDIDVGELGDRISFYGSRTAEFFGDFYAGMEIILSPNVPFVLQPGAFDGFPTGCCIEAGMCGVAVVCTDCMKQNVAFRDGWDIVIISRKLDEIVDRLQFYCTNPHELYALSERGCARFQQVFGRSAQIEPRFKIIERFLGHE
jgi:glycosyltransferase involved in cell wall biosynthesis